MLEQQCPHCKVPLTVRGWHIPGMRSMADLVCTVCGRQFYGDLPSGQALHSPMLLDRSNGDVHSSDGAEWFANWLKQSFAERVDVERPFRVRNYRPIGQSVVLLNCLDAIFGHSLLKLLNAQRYINTGVDLIVLVPATLEWLVPDSVAETWVIDVPPGRGTEWNEWVALQIRQRLEGVSHVELSNAFSHPHPDDYDIQKFSRVAPFPLGDWKARLSRPTVTFIWRDDRSWEAESRSFLARPLRRIAEVISRKRDPQTRNLIALAERLRKAVDGLDFAVAGLGTSGELPDWIKDERRMSIQSSDELRWCERYAASHVVIGVHGSNMLLPSAHAGSVVDLMPEDRNWNVLQDLLTRGTDARDQLFRYRLLTASASVDEVANLVHLILTGYPGFVDLMGRDAVRHSAGADWVLTGSRP